MFEYKAYPLYVSPRISKRIERLFTVENKRKAPTPAFGNSLGELHIGIVSFWIIKPQS